MKGRIHDVSVHLVGAQQKRNYTQTLAINTPFDKLILKVKL